MYMRSLFCVEAVILGSLLFGGCVNSLGEHEIAYRDDAITLSNAPSPDPQALGGGGCTAQQVWTGTLFYADAAKTQLIGRCSITCNQWIRGVASPEPNDGASCQGTFSNFQIAVISTCTGCQF